jgi:phospholipid/cholesterol/gamma-HCH transport system substrate-binding protein
MPSTPAWKNLATGLFFLLTLVILVTGLLIVGTNQNILARTYTIHTYLPDTQSLAEGTAVTLSGIEIGVIQNISLATYHGENRVRFDLKLRRQYQDRITTSSTGIVKSIGVLGDKFLEIGLGKAGEPPLQDGAVIETEPAVDWEGVIRNFSQSVIASVERLRLLLDRVERGEGTLGTLVADSTLVVRLTTTLEGVEANLSAIRERRGTLGRLIYEPAVYEGLQSAVENLDHVASRLVNGHGTLGRLLADSTLYEHTSGAAASLDSVMARVNAGRGTVGRALADEEAYDELHKAIQDLRILLIDMQKHPERYVRFSVF